MIREIRFYKNYFLDFYISLDSSTQEKIEYVFKVIRTVDRITEKFFKHLEGTDGLYEIRIKAGSNIYRVFCCFDTGRIVILLMGSRRRVRRHPEKRLQKLLNLKMSILLIKKETSHEDN